jgi:hypothetical protein
MDQMICTVRKERDGQWVRAIVVVHETPHREVHATQWCGTSDRAKGWADWYCKRNNLTIVYSDF